MVQLRSLLQTVLLAASVITSAVATCGHIEGTTQVLDFPEWNGPNDVSFDITPWFSTTKSVDPTRPTGSWKTRNLLRFPTLAGHTNCQLFLSIPNSRWYEVLQGGSQGPALLSIYKVSNTLPEFPTYNDLQIVPGPWAVAPIQSGMSILGAESCEQFNGQYLIEIPDWAPIVGPETHVAWGQDIRVADNDPDNSLGFFVKYDC
ncbi:hypothetical protein GQ53DRAFT_815366 [Thozetella sp. PMI_491]|nr:hypothetical protein GQ53DRAFT_815366 [Thozetella sp. PMI_491]